MPPSPPPAGAASFAARLARAISRVGAPVCVGLDPVVDKLPGTLRDRAARDPAGAITEFCLHVLDAVAPAAAAVKPQSACFERFGSAGFVALERVVAHARGLGLPVVLDAKRGDIGVTAEHYAAWAFEHLQADALTVNAYLGPDTLEAYLAPRYTDRAMFVLVRTSNPQSDAVQALPLHDGRSVAAMMADLVTRAGAASIDATADGGGLSRVGAVVGATKPADAAALRARLPHAIILVPGYGAQGGTAADVHALVRAGAAHKHHGVLVNASRSVLYAFEPGATDWPAQVHAAAGRMRDDLRTAGL